MICSHCNGTGELGEMGFLDCTNCSAADERAALNATLAALPPVTRDDLNWAAYKAGVALSEERHAREVAELAAMVRKMWGWAIELGATPEYWTNAPAPEDQAEWRNDIEKAQQMILRYKPKD